MLIDTHSHLNFNAFKEDADQIIDQCLKNDVWMINVGSQQKTSRRAVALAQKHEKGVYAAVGLHPIHTISSSLDPNELDIKTKIVAKEFIKDEFLNLTKNEKVVAIGEVGLDYFYAKTKEEKAKQEKTFIQQIKLAQEVNLPVIVHCREAWEDLITILQKFYKPSTKRAGVTHFFSGNIEESKKILDLGFLISFTGVITFTRAYDKVIESIPLNKLMIETDCPYVSPEPFRGKRNLPLYVKYVAKRIAEIKNVSFEKVAEMTTKNAFDLFDL